MKITTKAKYNLLFDKTFLEQVNFQSKAKYSSL